MKKSALIIGLLFIAVSAAFAQFETPITWAYFAKRTSPTEAVVYIKATIDPGWHIYSQNVAPGGPNKTKIAFASSKDFSLIGKTAEPKPVTYFDKIFKMNVSYFEDQVVFSQKIKLSKKATTVKGTIEFSVCNAKACLPPDDVAFSVPII